VLELLLGNVGAEPAQLRVIGEGAPRDRIVAVAKAHEAAEADDGVAHAARLLVDHQMIDLADMLAVRAVNFGAMHVLARDQLFVRMSGCSCHCFCTPLSRRYAWAMRQHCSRSEIDLVTRSRPRFLAQRSLRRTTGLLVQGSLQRDRTIPRYSR